MKKAISLLLVVAILSCTFVLHALAGNPAFSVGLTGTIDAVTTYGGRNTFVIDWQFRANEPNLSLTNAQGLRLAYDNTVFQLVRWNAGQAIDDGSLGATEFTAAPQTANAGVFPHNPVVFAAKNATGEIGYLNLTVGSAYEIYECAPDLFESIMRVRLAFREGKSESDIGPGSIRLMTVSELDAFAQDTAMRISACSGDDLNTMVSYVYLLQEGGVPKDSDTLNPPTINLPENPGVSDSLTLSAEGMTTRAGKSVSVPILVSGNPGFAQIRIDVTLHEDLEWDYDPANYGDDPATWPFVSSIDVMPISGRPAGANLAGSFASLYFAGEGGNSGGDGTLVTLKLKVKEGAGVGEKPIIVNVVTCRDESLANVPCNFEGGIITVVDFVYGDVNGDRIVDDLDHLILTQYINGWPVIIDSGADVNGDGNVDYLDLILLTQYINGWPVTLGPSNP